MSYSIILFLNVFFIFYKLFENPKYLIFFDIVKYLFSEWWNSKNFLILQIEQL